jgi:hypothetical protein
VWAGALSWCKTPKHTQAIIDATRKETAIDQQQHSCETLIYQRYQTVLRFLSTAATASTRWRVREFYFQTSYIWKFYVVIKIPTGLNCFIYYVFHCSDAAHPHEVLIDRMLGVLPPLLIFYYLSAAFGLFLSCLSDYWFLIIPRPLNNKLNLHEHLFKSVSFYQ